MDMQTLKAVDEAREILNNVLVQWDDMKEETKIALLNKANTVLYELKTTL